MALKPLRDRDGGWIVVMKCPTCDGGKDARVVHCRNCAKDWKTPHSGYLFISWNGIGPADSRGAGEPPARREPRPG